MVLYIYINFQIYNYFLPVRMRPTTIPPKHPITIPIIFNHITKVVYGMFVYGLVFDDIVYLLFKYLMMKVHPENCTCNMCKQKKES